MKNPKWRCAYPGTHKVKFGGKFLTQWSGYHLFLNQTEGGTITADKTKGGINETVTLSSIPNYGYTFEDYSLTGATLTGDQFNFVSSNVTAEGSFTEMPKHTITLQQTTGGTITASKLSGYINESANMSYTANPDYYFNGWQTTGASVQNNKVPFTQDTTAKGSFVYTNPYTTIHQTYNNKTSNVSEFWRWTGGNSDDLKRDYLPVKRNAIPMLSAQGQDTLIKNYQAIHYKFKNKPITLNGASHYYAFETEATAMGCAWDTGMNQWTASQVFANETTPNLYCDALKHFPDMSANRFPLFRLWLSRSSKANSTYGEFISGTLYAKCTDWTSQENDIKYLIMISAGSKTDRSYDRTTFISAYYNNNFVGSSWQNGYGVWYKNYGCGLGLFSATNNTASTGYYVVGENHFCNYKVYAPVAGSSQFDMGNFDSLANAKRWLDSL